MNNNTKAIIGILLVIGLWMGLSLLHSQGRHSSAESVKQEECNAPGGG